MHRVPVHFRRDFQGGVGLEFKRIVGWCLPHLHAAAFEESRGFLPPARCIGQHWSAQHGAMSTSRRAQYGVMSRVVSTAWCNEHCRMCTELVQCAQHGATSTAWRINSASIFPDSVPVHAVFAVHRTAGSLSAVSFQRRRGSCHSELNLQVGSSTSLCSIRRHQTWFRQLHVV